MLRPDTSSVNNRPNNNIETRTSFRETGEEGGQQTRSRRFYFPHGGLAGGRSKPRGGRRGGVWREKGPHPGFTKTVDIEYYK